ncbi:MULTISPECIES: DUF4177 domain-containing protein [Saccharibacillus]|uniref:DUF4177 domain-containing protein n=1 Tax=Saccharibacillus brassicae TaxID=2583377 RepID=A0A4Y6UZS3_SACBS|nr:MULTISPECIES: DUF4177 domain-containing protein [Saccharibacillus]MWJ31805.1 DUF4177 domain-containing protein [Saccharibacillus sp. WB 17]QDH21737.1 DUF4177 domain-containing protein [Saccharibacillus brassicae]
MYEYKFVKVELSSFKRDPKEPYHDIVHQYAAEGWRLNQIFAPAISGYGIATFYELIFERFVPEA